MALTLTRQEILNMPWVMLPKSTPKPHFAPTAIPTHQPTRERQRVAKKQRQGVMEKVSRFFDSLGSVSPQCGPSHINTTGGNMKITEARVASGKWPSMSDSEWAAGQGEY